MAYRPNPNDPFITPPPGDDFPRGTDPMMPSDRYDDAGPVSGTRVALYAVAVLALVGALFYGMSTATNDTASTTTPSSNVAQNPAAPTPPAVRDVTPRPNAQPGMTTGSAPATPAPAPTDTPKQ
jgi:type IV secretory pathway VirB10-like protein